MVMLPECDTCHIDLDTNNIIIMCTHPFGWSSSRDSNAIRAVVSPLSPYNNMYGFSYAELLNLCDNLDEWFALQLVKVPAFCDKARAQRYNKYKPTTWNYAKCVEIINCEDTPSSYDEFEECIATYLPNGIPLVR